MQFAQCMQANNGCVNLEPRWHAPVFLHIWLMCATFFTKNSTNKIPKCRIDLLPELGTARFTQKKQNKNNTKNHERQTKKEGPMTGDHFDYS